MIALIVAFAKDQVIEEKFEGEIPYTYVTYTRK